MAGGRKIFLAPYREREGRVEVLLARSGDDLRLISGDALARRPLHEEARSLAMAVARVSGPVQKHWLGSGRAGLRLRQPALHQRGLLHRRSSACVGNTKLISQITGGFWRKLYQGPFGRLQVGMQYSYTEKRGYSGVGGQPNQNENILFTSLRYHPF